MGSEAIIKAVTKAKRKGKILSIIFITFLVFLVCSIITGGVPVVHPHLSPRPPPSLEECPDVMKSFDRTQPQTKSSSWQTKPIWFNMYPDTIPDSVHAKLINPLTNTPAGGKSYYVSAKGKNHKLRHCMGVTQTVTCSNVHPAVEFKEGQLDSKYSTTFYEKYILVLRNPMTVFPSSVDAKNQKYHNMVGQTPEDQWKKTRDEWFENMCKGWKAVITAWRSTKYDIGMYLVYEDIFSAKDGPQTLLNLGTFLKEANYSVPALDNLDSDSSKMDKRYWDRMHCLWYDINPEFSKSLGQQKASAEDSKKTMMFESFPDYIPSYTKKQQDHLLSELDSMVTEFKDDEDLIQILLRYRKDIEKKMRIDG